MKSKWPKANKSGVYLDDSTAKRFRKSFGKLSEIERYVELTVMQVAPDEWVSGHYYTTGDHFRDESALCRSNGVHNTFLGAVWDTAGRLWDYMAKRSRDGIETAIMNWLGDVTRSSTESEIDQISFYDEVDESTDRVKDEDPAMYDGKPIGTQAAPLMITEISVSTILPSPYQTRKRFDGIEELAESLKAHGLLQPIAIRALGPCSYELIAGERRLRAYKLAFGEEAMIPSRVLDISDSEAAELCVTENMQRSDLTPLEEAEGVKYLLDTGHTIQDTADRLGRSPLWVRRRSNLLALCQDVRDAIEDTSNSMSIAPIEGLELIAALPDDLQIKVARQFEYNSPKVDAIRLAISRLMHDLKNAPFSVSACITCLRRTGAQPDLFDGGETSDLGRCLDVDCWKQKRNTALKAMISEIKQESSSAIIVSDEYEIRQAVPGIRYAYEVTKCKKGDANAVQAYNIDKNGNAKKIWVKKPRASSDEGTSDSSAPRRPTTEQKEMAEYVNALRKKIESTLELSDGKSRAVAGHPFTAMPAIEILKTLMITGTSYSNSYVSEREWGKAFDLDDLSVRDNLWPKVANVLLQRTRYNTIISCEPQYLEAVDINQYLFGCAQA